VTAVLPAMIVFGLGLAATVAPITAVALEGADERYAGAASGVNNAVARGRTPASRLVTSDPGSDRQRVPVTQGDHGRLTHRDADIGRPRRCRSVDRVHVDLR
jgi:hypothetical protein